MKLIREIVEITCSINIIEIGNVHTVGPNEMLVIFGGSCGSSSIRPVIGEWASWLVTSVRERQNSSRRSYYSHRSCPSEVFHNPDLLQHSHFSERKNMKSKESYYQRLKVTFPIL